VRKLEIGAITRIDTTWETLNIVTNYSSSEIDIFADAAKPLTMIKSETYDYILVGQVLEHISWLYTHNTLTEWLRILTPNGKIEIWVPNFKTVVLDYISNFGITPFIQKMVCGRPDPCLRPEYAQLHKAVFDIGYLIQCMREAGFRNVYQLTEPIYYYKHPKKFPELIGALGEK
jgi:predicted SAM-dependent methyltransferase